MNHLVLHKTRLDPVVRLQEHRESTSMQELAEANRKVAAAQNHLSEARRRVTHDARQPGAAAADWMLAESAHARALADAAAAQRSAASASEGAGASRTRYVTVHARAQALRRLQTARAGEASRAEQLLERKEADELFIVRSSLSPKRG